MGQNAGGIDFLEEVNGHTQIHVAHALDGQADSVFTGIKHAVLAGAIILEKKQAVAVRQRINVLGFTCVIWRLRLSLKVISNSRI